jgi:putative transposase
MITDIISGEIVGWAVHIAESACLGAAVIEKAALCERIHGKPLVLHSDSGSPMRTNTLPMKLYELGNAPSNSRPRVSDDNVHIESFFKTSKYTPKFQSGGFKYIERCREWTQKFVPDYNSQHRHKGISWVTPIKRHEKLDLENLERRSRVYASARQANPNRWSGEERKWSYINSVTLNGRKEPNINKIEA